MTTNIFVINIGSLLQRVLKYNHQEDNMANKSGKKLSPIKPKPSKITKIAKQWGNKKIPSKLKTADGEVMRALEKAKPKVKSTKKTATKKSGTKKK
jgi:hypothetical protein